MEYNINKGIGRNVEFNGLQAQYLYFFVGGLLAIFLLFVIFYMIGIDRWFCIGFGVLSAFSLIFGVFHLNKKYGPNGLMKLAAVKYHPSYIINRKRISSLFKKRIHEKYIKSRNAGKYVSNPVRGGRVHSLQRRGRDHRLQGLSSGAVHGHFRRLCIHARHMNKGSPEQFLHPLPGEYNSEGSPGQRNGQPVFGECRPVRAHPE